MFEVYARVLVVEDSATMRGFITSTLESVGIEIVQASNGFEALRLMPRARFDLVISDINMPDINGLELVRFIRESPDHRETPLLLISTDGRDADRERGLRLGADAYLVKPFEPEALLAAVRRLLNRPLNP
jgi:two-component system chemotaxis response regulator CheY